MNAQSQEQADTAATIELLRLELGQCQHELTRCNDRIEEMEHAEAMLAGENRILDLIARGEPLSLILDSLCRLAEETCNGSLCSILLLDAKGDRLLHGAAPSLPSGYISAFGGSSIGPNTGPCGRAIYFKEPVIVCDIAADLMGEEYRNLALAHGLRSCWSTPVFSSDGRAFGTFAMLSREPRSPTTQQQNIIDQMTHLASIVIGRKQAAEALQASEKLARGQVDALTSTLDALAMESAPDRLLEHVLRTITTQLEAHSSSVWQRNRDSGLINFQYSFENNTFVTKSDSVLAGISLELPMEEFWPWLEVFRTGKPGIMEDIRELPFFPWQERLKSLGVITILIVPLLLAGRVDAVIGVRFTQKRVFSPDELELAQALASQATLAMQLTRLSGESRDSAVIAERNRSADALFASEKVARGQVATLKQTLDALATESDPNHLLGHILCAITEQFGAHSTSVWRRDEASNKIGFEGAFEDGKFVHKTDARFVGIDLWLPMEDFWPWPEVFRTGEPSVIEDIRDVPPFALRDRLLPLGIVTVLLVPLFVGGRLEGAIGLRFTQKRPFGTDEVELAQALANQATLAMQLTRLSAESRESAVIAERNRMARDIHDTLAQGLTGVIVQLEAAADATSKRLDNAASKHIERAGYIARQSLKEARRSVRALRPKALEEKNLCEALDELLRGTTAGTTIRSKITIHGQVRLLPPEWDENILRISQEVVTNALRHARASEIEVLASFNADNFGLQLRDNGQGFDLTAKHDGFGIIGIKERVKIMGGKLTVKSSPGHGATIFILLPYIHNGEAS